MAGRLRTVIPDDHRDAVRGLDGHARLAGFDVAVHNDNATCTPRPGYVEKDSYEMCFGAAFANIAGLVGGGPFNAADPAAAATR